MIFTNTSAEVTLLFFFFSFMFADKYEIVFSMAVLVLLLNIRIFSSVCHALLTGTSKQSHFGLSCTVDRYEQAVSLRSVMHC